MLIIIICIVLAIVSATPVTDNNSVKILNYQNSPLDNENRYHFNYELSDGQHRTEEGELRPNSEDPSKKSLFVTGFYEFTAPNGELFIIRYTADENGFHPIVEQAPSFPSGAFGAPAAPGLSPNAIASLIG